MEYTYDFSISIDTQNGLLYSPTLESAIESSSFTQAYNRIDTSGDDLFIVFDGMLNTVDQDLLTTLVNNHDGVEPNVSSTPYQVEFEQKDALGISILAVEKPADDFDTLVTPNFTQTAKDPVTGNDFEVKPDADKFLTIEKAECQFEHDLQISGVTTFHLDYYVWFNHPTAGWIEVVGTTRSFDSIRALFELGNEHYHSPAIGTEMPTGLTTISFSYPSALKLYGTPTADYQLSKLVCRLENDTPATGSYVTIGFVTKGGLLA